MSKRIRPGEATPRRDFLRTLALAPAAVAVGCATSTGAAGSRDSREEAPSASSGSAAGAGSDEDKSLRALRAHALPMDAEPALVFRAAPARPVE